MSLLIAGLYFSVQFICDGILPWLGVSKHEIYKIIAILPSDFWSGVQPWSPLSWLLLHDSWPALFYFIFVVISLGRFLEEELGRLKFLLILFVPASLSALPLLIFFKTSFVIVTGSYALVWSILSICLVYFPKTRVYFFVVNFPLWMFAMFLIIIHSLMFIPTSVEGGAWLVMPAGMTFSIIYAWAGLDLDSGNSMKQDIKILYLENFTKRKRSSRDYLKQLQEQKQATNEIKKPSPLQSSPEIKERREVSSEIDSVQTEDQKQPLDKVSPKPEQKSSEIKNDQQDDFGSEKRLLLDPKTGEFYFTD